MTAPIPVPKPLLPPEPSVPDEPALVDDIPEDIPPVIAGRGRLLSLDDVYALFRGARTRRWIKTMVCPSQRIIIGADWHVWETDLREWLDALRGGVSPMRRQHLTRHHQMRQLINEAVARRRRERRSE